MNQKQIIKDKITKRFVRTVYLDIATTICVIALFILIPLTLCLIFTPEFIDEVGYPLAIMAWIIGIFLVTILILVIYNGLSEWIKARWKKAEEEVMEKIMINENARRSERFK